MEQATSIKVTILGWEKINARKDVKEPSWFKFKHKFFDDSEFFGFSHSEKVTWLYILCECSKQNKAGVTTINHQHAHQVAGISTTILNSTIKKLQELRAIETPRARGRYVDVTCAGARQEEIRLEEIRGDEKEEEKKNVRKRTPKPKVLDGEETNILIAKFCEAYKSRYDVTYRITGREIGALKRIKSSMSLQVYERIVVAYLEMADQWFLTKRHDILTLEGSLAKVSEYEQSGRVITQTQIRDMDRKTTNMELLEKARRGEI